VTPGGARPHLCPSRSVYRGAGRPISPRRAAASAQISGEPSAAATGSRKHDGLPWRRAFAFPRCLPGAGRGRGCWLRPLALRSSATLGTRPGPKREISVPNRPHRCGGRPQADRCRALDARLQGSREHQPPRLAEAEPGKHVHFGMGQRRTERLADRPSRSATRLRAACTRVPSARVAHAPTAIFPVLSASQAWRNASCQESSRLDQSLWSLTVGAFSLTVALACHGRCGRRFTRR
jgi:hypothetical protein